MSDETKKTIEFMLGDATDANALGAAAEAPRIEAQPRTAAVLAGRLLSAAMAFQMEVADGTPYKDRTEFITKLLAQEVADCCQIAEADGLYVFVREALNRAVEIRNSAGRAAARAAMG